MHTIGRVARKYSVSRSTLIYYHSIGVLVPSGRSSSNYREYSDSDLRRMDRIQLFRSAGLSLDSIVMLLGKKGDELNATLEGRLSSINGEIQALRDQQKIILKILKKESAIRGTRVLTKKIWVSILEAAGLDDAAMENWHIEFEKTSPEAHQDFLETLGISDAEIARIRDRSKAFAH